MCDPFGSSTPTYYPFHGQLSPAMAALICKQTVIYDLEVPKMSELLPAPTKEQILKAAEICPEWKKGLEVIYPKAFEEPPTEKRFQVGDFVEVTCWLHPFTKRHGVIVQDDRSELQPYKVLEEDGNRCWPPLKDYTFRLLWRKPPA